ncbi:MAG: hypothetical protein IT174_15440 [Acidobacteria bacterium]|nr:hypothetical protein [Acidobacteriota bacterium]
MRTKATALFMLLAALLFGAERAAGQKRSGPPTQTAAEKPAGDWRKKMAAICMTDSVPVAARILHDYGAIFAADRSVTPPPVCIFSTGSEVTAFQSSVKTRRETIGDVEIELQAAAMVSLLTAIEKASERGLRISPRGGATAGKRSFADTLRLWNSRFIPALDHWVARGRIKMKDADAARLMPVIEQTEQVLAWETEGLFFSTGKDRSILTSVAATGTSQHLSMLALDVAEFGNSSVRRILNDNGWYQTVADDSPHFTYLGLAEADLPARGLRLVARGGFSYWVPEL